VPRDEKELGAGKKSQFFSEEITSCRDYETVVIARLEMGEDEEPLERPSLSFPRRSV
jgi:hypothetical protein